VGNGGVEPLAEDHGFHRARAVEISTMPPPVVEHVRDRVAGVCFDEQVKLRIAIWDTSGHAYDSLAVVDGFQWSADPSTPATVILESANTPLGSRRCRR
jgi:hypothetical protein